MAQRNWKVLFIKLNFINYRPYLSFHNCYDSWNGSLIIMKRKQHICFLDKPAKSIKKEYWVISQINCYHVVLKFKILFLKVSST